MSPRKEKQHLPSADGVSCSICLEAVQSSSERSVARLKCGHFFHLDCIGSAFNAKGAMQCPNCRQVEGGQWLYSSGRLLQQEGFERNDYARILSNLAYLHSERQAESIDLSNEAAGWPSRSYGHGPVSQGVEDSPINSYPSFEENERRHQRVPRYQSGVVAIARDPGFDQGQIDVAHEMGLPSAHSNEIARPLLRDLHPSHASAMYLQSLQAMVPGSYEESYANMIPDLYASLVRERPGYSRRMDDNGYEEHSMLVRPVGRRHSIHRELSDRYYFGLDYD